MIAFVRNCISVLKFFLLYLKKSLVTPPGFSDLPTALLNIDRFVASSLLTKYFGIGWCMTLTYNRCTLFNCFWVGGYKKSLFICPNSNPVLTYLTKYGPVSDLNLYYILQSDCRFNDKFWLFLQQFCDLFLFSFSYIKHKSDSFGLNFASFKSRNLNN